MNHGEGHPILHACLQTASDQRDAMAGQITRLDQAMVRLGGELGEADVEPTIAEAANSLSILFEFGKVSWCNCRVAGWYYTSLIDLQKHAIRHLGDLAGRSRVPITWRPM